jgi:hypothetical protein
VWFVDCRVLARLGTLVIELTVDFFPFTVDESELKLVEAVYLVDLILSDRVDGSLNLFEGLLDFPQLLVSRLV